MHCYLLKTINKSTSIVNNRRENNLFIINIFKDSIKDFIKYWIKSSYKKNSNYAKKIL